MFYAVGRPETTCNLTAQLPANVNKKLHNVQTGWITVRKTVTNSVDKTHKNLFTVDIPETTCNFTAKLLANVNEKLHNVQTDCATVGNDFFCGQKQKASPKGRLFVSKTNIR